MRTLAVEIAHVFKLGNFNHLKGATSLTNSQIDTRLTERLPKEPQIGDGKLAHLAGISLSILDPWKGFNDPFAGSQRQLPGRGIESDITILP